MPLWIKLITVYYFQNQANVTKLALNLKKKIKPGTKRIIYLAPDIITWKNLFVHIPVFWRRTHNSHWAAHLDIGSALNRIEWSTEQLVQTCKYLQPEVVTQIGMISSTSLSPSSLCHHHHRYDFNYNCYFFTMLILFYLAQTRQNWFTWVRFALRYLKRSFNFMWSLMYFKRVRIIKPVGMCPWHLKYLIHCAQYKVQYKATLSI